jgi:hypothetical protein
MRKLFSILAAGALALTVAAPSHAAPVQVSGSLAIAVGTLPPINLPIPLSTVDLTGSTVSIAAGLAGVTGLFVPITGFPLNLITGIVVTASNGAGSFSVPAPADGGAANIPGGGFGGLMPILGVAQVKGALAINVPLSNVGVGGSVNAGGIVVEGAPWTTGSGMVTTTAAPMAMVTIAGSMNGALGAASSTVSLVSPAHINAAGLTRIGTVASLNLHFIPEPGTVLLLGAGIAGLVAVGRKRSS